MLEVNFGKLLFSRFWFRFTEHKCLLCTCVMNNKTKSPFWKTKIISNFTYKFVIRPYSAFKFVGGNRKPKDENLRFWPKISASGIPLLWQYGLPY